MTKDELSRLIERLDDKARRNEENFQSTGTARYDYERRRAEEMADALRIALKAKDDHDKLINTRTLISDWGVRAVQLDHEFDEEKVIQLIRDIKWYAVHQGLCRDLWA